MYLYVGTFLIALSTLSLEVTMARLLSVTTWYHLAFFAISTAMLGMTAGATTVYLREPWFKKESVDRSVGTACFGFAASVPITLLIICLVPLVFMRSLMAGLAFLLVTAFCTLPFYFSGIAITAILTKYNVPIGRIYATDLIGASLGCLFVLGGLRFFDAPSLILLCSSMGVAAGISFTWNKRATRLRRPATWAFVLMFAIAIVNSTSFYLIRPHFVKGGLQYPDRCLAEKWNSFSRILVGKRVSRPPQYWGPSPKAPTNKSFYQYGISIDGLAGTWMRQFASLKDIDHLRYDIVNVAYYLRPTGGACIIGVGGGRDLQSAILFGHHRVVGIDVNAIIIGLHKEKFQDFAGLANREGVTLVADEARSYLTHVRDKFAVVQMSLIDTWASTGAGAFSLSENTLYTVEAWRVFLSRLQDDGLFTVSRWYSPGNLGETGRVVGLAVASLLDAGISRPADHIAMLTIGNVSTLILDKSPFRPSEVDRLKEIARNLEYQLAIVPGEPPQNEALRAMLSANSMEALRAAVRNAPLNYNAPTDENPYFFNMLRLGRLDVAIHSEFGTTRGNLVATLVLIATIVSLVVLTFLTIVFPLLLGTRRVRPKADYGVVFWHGAVYFSLLGAGFMLVEIGLIQRLSVFLGHPAYALGVLLFVLILSTGLGSLLSDRLLIARPPWLYLLPILATASILAIRWITSLVISEMITASLNVRILVSIGMIAPLGIVLGFFFPTGMNLARLVALENTPWYWALNGIFGVLCSALAVFIAIYFGISLNFYIGAACYLFLIVGIHAMYRASLARSV